MYENSKELRVLPNLEWVEVNLGCNLGCCEEEESKAIAMAARASVMVWQAIAACRGFAVSENGAFWRRVFDKLYRVFIDDSSCIVHTTIKAMTAELQLFDGVPFPRLKLALESRLDGATLDRIAHIFIGAQREDSEIARRIEGELKEALNQLNTLASFSHTTELAEMQVSLDVSNWTDIPRLQQLITAIESRHTAAAEEEQAPLARLLSSQRWKVMFVHRETFGFDSIFKNQFALGRSIRLRSSNHYSDDRPGLRVEFMRYVQWALCVDARDDDEDGSVGGGVERLTVQVEFRPHGIDAICSALPLSKILIGLQLSSRVHLVESDLAWIAYALFHPEAASSSWEKLDMSNLAYRSTSFDATQVISMMAMGNNLPVMLGLSTLQVDRYFSATIQEGAVLYATAPLSTQAHGQDSDAVDASDATLKSCDDHDIPEIVLVMDKGTTMDVCVVTTDVEALDAWIAVIVPGFGVAYVASSFVAGIAARAPGRPFLKRMRVDRFDCPGSVADSLLIRLCGGELDYLDYVSSPMPPSLQPIYDACPRLKSYRLFAPYSALKEWKPPPGLRELHVVAPKPPQLIDRLDATFLTMTSLETLRLEMYNTPTLEDINGFVLPLLRGLKQLRRFYWMTKSDHDRHLERATYAQRRAVARLMIPGLVKGVDDIAVVSKSPTAVVVALLSVVRHHCDSATEELSVIGQLGQDQVSLIGEFVGTVVPREIWIDGNKWNGYRRNAAGGSALDPSSSPWDACDY